MKDHEIESISLMTEYIKEPEMLNDNKAKYILENYIKSIQDS